MLTDGATPLISLDKLVQTIEPCDQGIRVGFDVVIVVLQNLAEILELISFDAFEQVPAVGGVEEKGSALPLTGERCHGYHFTHHKRSQ